jgi:putative DNA primase/helicase
MLNKSHLKKIQEFVGYTLMAGEYPWHKGLFIVGETRSGKSTFLKIIKKLYDDDATSVVAPQDLSDDYDAARLHNSMVNIENDVDDAMIENVGAFKKILAGDEISAGRKYKAKLEFCPTAKHIFATNKLPTADVDDSAFYQRVLLTMTDGTIPPEDRREFEEDEVQERIVENELSGILNWALDGLDRRKKQGYFTADYPVDKTKTRWRAWARSPSRFEYDCIEPATSNAVTKDVLEESYTEFCECRNLPQQPWSELRDTLSKVSGADRTKTTRGGRTKRGINGIELIDEWHPDRELYEETDS